MSADPSNSHPIRLPSPFRKVNQIVTNTIRLRQQVSYDPNLSRYGNHYIRLFNLLIVDFRFYFYQYMKKVLLFVCIRGRIFTVNVALFLEVPVTVLFVFLFIFLVTLPVFVTTNI